MYSVHLQGEAKQMYPLFSVMNLWLCENLFDEAMMSSDHCGWFQSG